MALFTSANPGPPSLSRNGHFRNQNRTGSRISPLVHIASDRLQACKHIAEIPCNCDFLDRLLDLTAVDPEPRGTARIIAGDDVHALPKQFRDQQAATHVLQQGRQIHVPGVDGEVMDPSRIPGTRHAQFSRRIGAEYIGLENPVLYEMT